MIIPNAVAKFQWCLPPNYWKDNQLNYMSVHCYGNCFVLGLDLWVGCLQDQSSENSNEQASNKLNFSFWILDRAVAVEYMLTCFIGQFWFEGSLCHGLLKTCRLLFLCRSCVCFTCNAGSLAVDFSALLYVALYFLLLEKDPLISRTLWIANIILLQSSRWAFAGQSSGLLNAAINDQYYHSIRSAACDINHYASPRDSVGEANGSCNIKSRIGIIVKWEHLSVWAVCVLPYYILKFCMFKWRHFVPGDLKHFNITNRLRLWTPV